MGKKTEAEGGTTEEPRKHVLWPAQLLLKQAGWGGGVSGKRRQFNSYP